MNVLDMLSNLSEALPSAQTALFMVFFLVGFILSGVGVIKIIQQRGAAGVSASAIWTFIAGTCLLSLVYVGGHISESLFNTSDPRQVLSVVPVDQANPEKTMAGFIVNVATLIGWLALGYALYLISGFGDSAGGRHQSKGAVVWYAIGGVLMTQIVKTVSSIIEQAGYASDPIMTQLGL